jgi:hypothetical protein
MLGTRITALILAALSVTALRAQDNTATPNQHPVATHIQPRPEITLAADPPVQLPPVMHLCLGHCFPVMWDKGHYVQFGPENTGIYTVESFTRESFILHRVDKGRFPLTATLTGQMSAEGNSVVNGRVDWTSGNSGTCPFKAAWGNALGTLPGGADEDELRGLVNIPCDASSSVSIAQADARAEQLMELDDMASASCWLRIGAKQGDAEAQGMLASVLYRGIEVPVNIPEAAIWADKSSAQNNYLGDHILWLMYANGKGKPKDPAKAEFWRARYEKDKLASERAEEQAKEAQRQRAQAQAQQNAVAGLFMLQLFLGAFSGDSDRSGSNPSAVVDRINGMKENCANGGYCGGYSPPSPSTGP